MLQESKRVILVFSVQGSGHFQGDGLVEVIFSICCPAVMISCTKKQSLLIYLLCSSAYRVRTDDVRYW